MNTTTDNISEDISYLKQARSLIAQPYGWAKGSLYKRKTNRKGEYVTSYCAMGAIQSVCGIGEFFDVECILEETIRSKGFHNHGVAAYNDLICKKKADILSLFDETIARLETKTAA